MKILNYFGFGLVCILFCIYLVNKNFFVKEMQCCEGPKNSRSKTCEIAILVPLSHPSLEQIQKGFIDTLKNSKNVNYKFDVFNANGNTILMKSQAEQIILGKYDLVFTVGTGASKIVKELASKKQVLIPIVFGAVSRPEELGLINSKESSGNNLVGVIEDDTYADHIDALLKIKPDTKKILLVYNPSQGAGLEKDKDIIKLILESKNIELSTLSVNNGSEIQPKLSSVIGKTDVVLVLKDNTVVSAIDIIIKLCNRNSKLLFASDLDSVDKGAGLAYGVHEIDFGVTAAKLAIQIIEQNKKPTDLKTSVVGNRKLKINTKTINQQGLFLSEMQLFLLNSCETVL